MRFEEVCSLDAESVHVTNSSLANSCEILHDWGERAPSTLDKTLLEVSIHMSICAKSISVAVLMLTLLLAACGGTTDTVPKTPTPVPETPIPETPTPQKEVSIERLGWILENRDSSRTSSGATALLRPSVKFADTGLEASDFASIKITSPTGTSWPYDEASDFEERFDSENDVFYFFSLYASSLDGGSYVALGNYTVDVVLKNGNTATKTLLVPAPASSETDGYAFAYTENYANAANPPSDYIALPKRATVESATLDSRTSQLDVAFSVTDDRIYSGWLRLYNAEGEYIGYTEDFRDYEEGTIMSQLNSGTTFFTDGAANTLSVSADQLDFFEPEIDSFADVASVLVVLTDGEQYAGTDSFFDTMSTSSKFDVSMNQ